jgi:hypothetical protein
MWRNFSNKKSTKMFIEFRKKTKKKTLPYRRQNSYSMSVYINNVKMRILLIIEDFRYYQWWEKLLPSILAIMKSEWLANNNGLLRLQAAFVSKVKLSITSL